MESWPLKRVIAAAAASISDANTEQHKMIVESNKGLIWRLKQAKIRGIIRNLSSQEAQSLGFLEFLRLTEMYSVSFSDIADPMIEDGVSCSINCGLKFRSPEHLFEADDHDDQDAEPPKTTITVQHVPRTSAVQVGEIQAYSISSSNSLASLASMGSSDSASDNAVPYQCQPRFKPSRPRTGASRSASPKTIQQAALAGVDLSSRYQGGISDFNIKNAMCPGELNCAVRISNIPPEAEDKELFALINNGKVFSFNKNPPMPGVHPTSAADLSFTTREGAEGFMWRANQPSGIYLRGNRLRVFWNRNRCCPVPDSDRRQSRVVHIQGPADKISVDVLENYLQKFVVFQLVDGKEWLLNGGQKVVELSFGSIRGQSRCAFKCLLENFKDTSLDGLLGIRYGPDPCGPVQQSATHTSTN